jgi:hypothetical protein
LGNKAVYEIRQPMMQSRKITTVTHPQCRARESGVDAMSPVGASIYCSPCCPSALQIDPPTADGDLPL